MSCEITSRKNATLFSMGNAPSPPFLKKPDTFFADAPFNLFFSKNLVSPSHSTFGTPSTKIIQTLFLLSKYFYKPLTPVR